MTRREFNDLHLRVWRRYAHQYGMNSKQCRRIGRFFPLR